MYEIETRIDQKRGCGWRSAGGLYLMSGRAVAHCERMPQPLTVCNVCGSGAKPARGCTWVKLPYLIEHEHKTLCWQRHCGVCPLNTQSHEPEKMGLLWCGEQFYPTSEDYLREVAAQGVSRRIPAVPRELIIGKTWVLMAHRKAIESVGTQGKSTWIAGIIHAFIPTHIEYVVRGDESEEELQAKADRGITLVRVVRQEAELTLDLDPQEEEQFGPGNPNHYDDNT